MPSTNQIIDRVSIEGYGLYEFCQKIEPLLQQGYRFEFESNAGFPVAYGTVYCATFVKEQPVEQALTKEEAEAAELVPAPTVAGLSRTTMLAAEAKVETPKVKPAAVRGRPKA